MKKFLAVTSAVAMLAAGITVYADYNSADNSFTSNEAEGYSTVLIAAKSESALTAEDIIYINQAAAGESFNATMTFMLKENPKKGEYVMTLGGNGVSENKQVEFKIGADIKPEDQKMTSKGETTVTDKEGNTLYNMGFVSEGVNPSEYNSIVVVAGEGDNKVSGTWKLSDLFDVNIDGNIAFGLQVNNVPEAFKDSITVYLSAENPTDLEAN